MMYTRVVSVRHSFLELNIQVVTPKSMLEMSVTFIVLTLALGVIIINNKPS